MRPACLLAALAAVLALIAPATAARADATCFGGMDWHGPLMVSGNHPGSESAGDPNALDTGSGLIGCGPDPLGRAAPGWLVRVGDVLRLRRAGAGPRDPHQRRSARRRLGTAGADRRSSSATPTLSCPAADACAALLDGALRESTTPSVAAGWHTVASPALSAIGCPQTSLCFATVAAESQAGCAGDGECIVVADGVVHEIGDLAQASTWPSVRLAGQAAQLRRIDCPGSSLCVAAACGLFDDADVRCGAGQTAG
jgi:hypothetical protein